MKLCCPENQTVRALLGFNTLEFLWAQTQPSRSANYIPAILAPAEIPELPLFSSQIHPSSPLGQPTFQHKYAQSVSIKNPGHRRIWSSEADAAITSKIYSTGFVSETTEIGGWRRKITHHYKMSVPGMLAGVWKAGVSNEFITPGEEIGKENATFVYW